MSIIMSYHFCVIQHIKAINGGLIDIPACNFHSKKEKKDSFTRPINKIIIYHLCNVHFRSNFLGKSILGLYYI